MYLNLMALLYRRTGWFCPYAKIAQYEYIINMLPRIRVIYDHSDGEISLEEIVKIKIGIWQAKHGFTRGKPEIYK